MDCNITARNIELTSDIKKYIAKRLAKVERLYGRIYGCEVILEEEKIRKNVEIIVYLKRNKIIAKESTGDIFSSIDNASESIKKQLGRLSDKLKSQRRRNILGSITKPIKGFRGR